MIPSRIARRAMHRTAFRSSLKSRQTAVALIIPLRSLSTEPHTRAEGPHAGGPPPGFNSEKAKRPLVVEAQSKQSDTKAVAQSKPSEVIKKAADDAAENPTSLTQLVAEKAAQIDGKKDTKKEDKKLTLMQKIKREVNHYWDGTKLLATEVKISSRLAIKMAAGYELTRRENRQLQRTVQDLSRLVPFSVFVLVPFAELLLPIALKLFPNLLPSTYEGQKSKDKKASTLRSTRKEVSDYFRQTLKETGLPLSVATTQKEEFTNFFRKLRSSTEQPSAADVIKVCKIFRDDLTLDNLSRGQLISMCRYMNLSTFGTDVMLRYQVRHRMRQIKRDDRTISYEGVDSLTVGELQMACASRGIKSHGVSPASLREDLQTWMKLRLKDGVPSTLLVLSNAYMYGQTIDREDGESSQIEALTGVLSSIPEELFHEMELEVHTAEGAATNKQRLEVLREQEELIEEENEQNQENQHTGLATPRDTDDIDEKEEKASEPETRQAGKAETKQAGEAVQSSEAADAEQDSAEAAQAARTAKQAEQQRK